MVPSCTVKVSSQVGRLSGQLGPVGPVAEVHGVFSSRDILSSLGSNCGQ